MPDNTPRNYARLDVSFTTDPKIKKVSLAARGLFVSLITEVKNHSPDDCIDAETARDLGNHRGADGEALLQELEGVGLIEKRQNTYRLVSFKKWNWSRDRVAAHQKKKREAGKLGGVSSGQSRRKKAGETATSTTTGKDFAWHDSVYAALVDKPNSVNWARSELDKVPIEYRERVAEHLAGRKGKLQALLAAVDYGRSIRVAAELPICVETESEIDRIERERRARLIEKYGLRGEPDAHRAKTNGHAGSGQA